MRKAAWIVVLVVFCCGWTMAQAVPDAWANWSPLIGEWVGEGGGQPGQASAGGSTFRLDLQGKIIVRTNFAEYPAAKERPAFRHDDLMIIYREAGSDQVRAEYFDSEGHVIHYVASEKDGAYTFESEATAGQPRYRLSYGKPQGGVVTITFEVASPDKPNEFRTYVQAKMRRR